jgi:3-methyladenine DNA glycosylase AlkD
LRKKDAAVAFVAAVQREFDANRNPELAVPMAKYMLGKFPFLGIRTPHMVSLLRPIADLHKPHIDEPFLAKTSRAMWKLPEREYHHAAAYFLYRHNKLLTPVSLPLLRELIQTNQWWDSVDALATRCLGPLVLRYPKLRGEMDAWSTDPDMWIRRCAIIHQLSYRDRTDVERLFEYCTANASDKEFFIRKAIGWALRQYARTDARAVVRYVKSHPELSNLSKREALKHC